MPAARKPIEEGCNFSISCPVEGHVRKRYLRGGPHFKIEHHPRPTAGQRRTMHEARMARRAAMNAWIQDRHGELDPATEAYADGTPWTVAYHEWLDHCKETGQDS